VAGLLAGDRRSLGYKRGPPPDQPVIPDAPLPPPVAVLVAGLFRLQRAAVLAITAVKPLGPVMIFTGFAWLINILTDTHYPVLYTVGEHSAAFMRAGVLYQPEYRSFHLSCTLRRAQNTLSPA
jgi:hypothetical protein